MLQNQKPRLIIDDDIESNNFFKDENYSNQNKNRVIKQNRNNNNNTRMNDYEDVHVMRNPNQYPNQNPYPNRNPNQNQYPNPNQKRNKKKGYHQKPRQNQSRVYNNNNDNNQNNFNEQDLQYKNQFRNNKQLRSKRNHNDFQTPLYSSDTQQINLLTKKCYDNNKCTDSTCKYRHERDTNCKYDTGCKASKCPFKHSTGVCSAGKQCQDSSCTQRHIASREYFIHRIEYHCEQANKYRQKLDEYDQADKLCELEDEHDKTNSNPN